MESYVDYNYYIENGGNMPEFDFNRFSKLATAKIKANTFDRVDITNIPEEIKYCTCVIANKLKTAEKNDGKSSESVGSWSVSYDKNTNAEVVELIKEILQGVVDANGVPLLYRGC